MFDFKTNIYTNCPVISVIKNDNEKTLVTLREFFINSKNYSDLNSSFTGEHIAFKHFIILIGIAMCAKIKKYEFKNSDDFIDHVISYLDNYKNNFELAGTNNYFLQHNDNEEIKQKNDFPISKLIVENNTKSVSTKYNMKDIFFALLQGHLIGFGGLGGGFAGKPRNFYDTIASKGMSIFIKKNNFAGFIYENVLANVIYNKNNYENDSNIIPIWECTDGGKKTLSDNVSLNNTNVFQKFGYERIIKINWEIDAENNQLFARTIKMVQGLVKSKEIDKNYLNVGITNSDNFGYIYLKVFPEKLIWRDFYSILYRFSLIDKFYDNQNYDNNIDFEINAIYSEKADILGSTRKLYSLPKIVLNSEKFNEFTNYINLADINCNHLYANFKSAIAESRPKANSLLINRDINHTSAFLNYWNFIDHNFSRTQIFQKFGNNYDEFIETFEMIITEAKLFAANIFISDCSNGKHKYKMAGLILNNLKLIR